MIVIKLKGGLGNQMFQYAYGRNIMLTQKKKVVFNISFFKDNKHNTDTNRSFLLENFSIPPEINFESKQEKFYIKFIKKILRKLNFKFEEYFQSEKYFKNIKDIIQNEFTLKTPLSPKAIEWKEKINLSNNSTSVHIRRTDYINNSTNQKIYTVCDQKYYQNAVLLIKEKLTNQVVNFFIFSDDIEWVKQNLKFENTEYVSDSNLSECEELVLMSYCKHNIIANSTFSWWGAWLNKNKDKIVISPKNWFLDAKSNKNDIVPETWIKL
jgi:hypothetical protein